MLRDSLIDAVEILCGEVESALLGTQSAEPHLESDCRLIAGAKRFDGTQQLFLRRGVFPTQQQHAPQVIPYWRRQRRIRVSSHANLAGKCAPQQLLGFCALAEPGELHPERAFGIVGVGMVLATDALVLLDGLAHVTDPFLIA